MKINGWIVFGAFIVTFLLGAFISKIVGDRKLDKAKFTADSIATLARQDSLNISHFSDSMKTVVLELQIRKNKVIRVSVVDSQTVDSLKGKLKVAQTLADSNVVLTNTIGVLEHQVLTLSRAVAIGDSISLAERQRGDSLQTALNTATNRIMVLNNKIQGLHPRLPKLVRYGIEGTKLVSAFYAGRQYEKNRHK